MSFYLVHRTILKMIDEFENPIACVRINSGPWIQFSATWYCAVVYFVRKLDNLRYILILIINILIMTKSSDLVTI
jgi:hypothetical protein